MTYEDAWANIKMLIKESDEPVIKQYNRELELAVEALKKQVLYKVEEGKIFVNTFVCPGCGKILYPSKKFALDNHNRYCEHCGQYIDCRPMDDYKSNDQKEDSIVHCKDCINSNVVYNTEHETMYECGFSTRTNKPDAFCSWGKEKD